MMVHRRGRTMTRLLRRVEQVGNLFEAQDQQQRLRQGNAELIEQRPARDVQAVANETAQAERAGFIVTDCRTGVRSAV